jgi:uncharacterized membrane protein
MTLSPYVFLRTGFVILGLGAAFAVWLGDNGLSGWWLMGAGLAAFAVVTGIGEVVASRAATQAERAADLADRVRNPPG